jgi:hypothetical protein
MLQSGMNFRHASLVLVTLPAVTVFAGCTGLISHTRVSPEYGITTNEQIYKRGGSGLATIRNTSSKPLDYNLCPRRLERRVNKYWVVATEVSANECPRRTRTLPKGRLVRTPFGIPAGVDPDTYRVVFTGLQGKDGRSLPGDRAATPAFEVR